MENDLYVDSLLKAEGLLKADTLVKADYIRRYEEINQLNNTSVVIFILLFIVSLYIIYKNRK